MNNKKLLLHSEIFFKFAFAIHKSSPIPLRYLKSFSWSKQQPREIDWRLTKKEEYIAPGFLHHVATHTLAVQIDTFLQQKYADRLNHSDNAIKSASWIARLMRNAFAHNPFNPIWILNQECTNKNYVVQGIIELNTRELEGKPLKREHYGGPIAILKLSEFVRRLP